MEAKPTRKGDVLTPNQDQDHGKPCPWKGMAPRLYAQQSGHPDHQHRNRTNLNWGLTNHQNRKPDNELNRVKAGTAHPASDQAATRGRPATKESPIQ